MLLLPLGLALDRRDHQVAVKPVVTLVAQGEQAMLGQQAGDLGRFGLRAALVSWIAPRSTAVPRVGR